MDQIEIVENYFRKCLDKGMGDLEAMLAGIRYRLVSGGKSLDAGKRPPGYRSEKLRSYLKERGARKTTLWGATAIRGDLEPEKKGHIIEFLKLVNELPSDRATLEKALEVCAGLFVEKVNAETPRIELALKSGVQASIIQLLRVRRAHATAGKLQQGLVYALLRFRYEGFGKELEILTKRTHAGDSQSGILGDIRILKNEDVLVIYEVKGTTLDKFSTDRILTSHGRHRYPLFILALGFDPLALKQELNERENTFAIDLDDYFWTIFSEIMIEMGMTPIQALQRLVKVYNEEFCEKIERDNTIKINDVQP